MRCAPLFLLLVLALGPTGTIRAEDAPVDTSAVSEATFPGVADIVPAKTRLSEEATALMVHLEAKAEHDRISSEIPRLEEQQEDFLSKIAELDAPRSWTIERLLDTRQHLDEQRQRLQKLLTQISTEAADLDTAKQEWLARQDYWNRWREELPTRLPVASRSAFTEAHETINRAIISLDNRQGQNIAVQQELSKLLESLLDVSNAIDQSLETLRSNVFKKSAPALYSHRYWRLFNIELLEATRQGISNSTWTRPDFYTQHVPVMAVQLLIFLATFILVRLYNRDEIASEWQFLASHPLASALFVSFVTCALFYQQPPNLVSLTLRATTIISAAFLLKGLVREANALRALYALLVVVIGNRLLESFFFPTTIRRLYLLLAALFLTFFLLRTALRERRRSAPASFLPTLLLAGAALFLTTVVAQVLGYSTLAFWISDVAVNSLFTVLLLLMVLHLLRGAIDFIIASAPLQNLRFFTKHGQSLAQRLKTLILLGVLLEGGLYLLVVWGVFDSPDSARSTVAAWGMDIGDTTVTLGMIAWAGLVMLLSFQLSWLVRSLLDVSILRSRRYDRGVRDAVRKLVHYSLLTLGLLIALTTAGVDPRVFALLGGAFGIGIGFGLQNIVNNFVSGIILLFERPIKVGDTIVIENEWGTIKRIGLRSTVVETLDNSEIIVPNSMLISEKVTNWTLSTASARVVMEVGVAYGSDIAKVLDILIEAGTSSSLVLSEPKVSAIFTGFGDSSLNFELRIWIADIRDRLHVKSDILHAIEKGLRSAHIEIPFPQRDLHVRSIDPATLNKLTRASRRESQPRS